MDTGDVVWAVFWRPFALPGRPDNGSWDAVSGRVVSVRADRTLICMALDNPNLPGYFGGDVVGDPLRFVGSAEAFPTQDEAQTNLKARAPRV